MPRSYKPRHKDTPGRPYSGVCHNEAGEHQYYVCYHGAEELEIDGPYMSEVSVREAIDWWATEYKRYYPKRDQFYSREE